MADNRVPKILQDVMGQAGQEYGQLDRLCFRDWLAKREWDEPDWVPVARSWHSGARSLFTTSALVEMSAEVPDKLVETHEWELFPQNNYWEGLGAPSEKRGMLFHPFVHHVTYHGYWPQRLTLAEDFVFSLGLYFEETSGQYLAIDDNGNLVPVARFRREGENLILEVDRHPLREYLRDRGCALVRYHDHSEYQDELVVAAPITEDFKGEWFAFHLWANSENVPHPHTSWSRLLGKDVILPYEEPAEGDEEPEPCADFVYDIDASGKEVRFTCSEPSLSSYFVDKGSPNYLTAVFFDERVLKKYFDEPRKYHVDGSQAGCLDLWSIPIARTEDGLVQVWLGDLSRIPYEEQLHWRQFNVPPRDARIPDWRFRRDFLAEFCEDDDPVSRFKSAHKDVTDTFRDALGEPLFLDLVDADRHRFDSLHVPIGNEQKDFDEQVNSLAVITSDSVNQTLVERTSGLRVSPELPRLRVLEEMLKQMGADDETAAAVVGSLRAVQDVRSAGSTHRKGEDYIRRLRKHGLEGKSLREGFLQLLNAVTDGLVLMKRLLKGGES